jgi:HSP20 family molecular chaperone IbpA
MFYTPARRQAFSPELRSVDHALERMLAGAFSHGGQVNRPRMTQDENSVTLSLDVPGVPREQLSITIDANIVRIESATEAPRSVKQAYELAHDIDADNSTAKLENGVLTLTLARLVPPQTAKTLNIS